MTSHFLLVIVFLLTPTSFIVTFIIMLFIHMYAVHLVGLTFRYILRHTHYAYIDGFWKVNNDFKNKSLREFTELRTP